MKILILFLLSFSSFAEEGKVLFKDKALFRLPGRVVFYSEASLLWHSLNRLGCLGDQSLLLKAIEMKPAKGRFKPFQYESIQGEMKSLEKILKVEKIKSFTFREHKLEDNAVLTAMVHKRCPKLKKKTLEDKELLSLEVHLRDRFGDGTDGLGKMQVYVQNIYQKTNHEWLLKK